MFTTQITPAEYEATVVKIAKINARAEKKGFTGRVTVDAEHVQVTHKNQAGIPVTYEMVDVTIGGEAPAYGGWKFIARLDWDEEAGLITSMAPGAEVIVNREGLVRGHCDHCKKIRARRVTYLVVNEEDGRQVQVGSTCIKDFIGWEGRVVFLTEDEVRKDVEDGWGAIGGGGERRYATVTVLAAAWAAIKTFGWQPASNFGPTTKGTVHDILDPRDKHARKIAAQVAPILDEQDEKAAEVRAFILSDAFGGASEYVTNLKAVIGAETVAPRNFGLLVSAPQAMFRAQEKTLVEKAADALPASEWFGTAKEKVEFTGLITGIRYIDGDFGSTVLYTIRNQKTGAQVKWFASREVLGDKQDVEVAIKGTVKKHDEYRGIKSTVLTRCKAV
jgi:hypothetical protein